MDETKARREITFSTVGISGVHATFTHDKTVWMAAPVLKARALFNRAHTLADHAARAQRLLGDVVARHPELYGELRPILLILAQVSTRAPWGAALDAEIAAQAEARAAAKQRRGSKFTH